MKQTFKPAASKKIMFWLIMSLAGSLGVVLFGKQKLSDPLGMAVALGYMFVVSLVFTLIFYSLPYFRVEIDERSVTGPGSPLGGWDRVCIPLADLDLQRVRYLLPGLGLYRLVSRSGQAITIWAFDEQEFAEMLALLKERKAAPAGQPLT